MVRGSIAFELRGITLDHRVAALQQRVLLVALTLPVLGCLLVSLGTALMRERSFLMPFRRPRIAHLPLIVLVT